MRVRLSMAVVLAGALTLVAAASQNPFVGNWNLRGTGEHADRVYWLEVKQENGQLAARFLNRGGSPVPVRAVALEGDTLVFTAASGTARDFRVRRDGGRLAGTAVEGGRRGRSATTVNLVGERPPTWPETNANGAHTFGTPVVLFDGKSMDTFGVQHADRDLGWRIEEGLMANQRRANNLVSKATFTDFRIEAEYKVADESNSGIYLRGRYELQVLDDAGDDASIHGHMAIYGRTPPRVNASKGPGEWQTMQATIVGNRVTVVLNGQTVHDNEVIGGITGGALDTNELEPGPIMIQGDHNEVWFRKIVVTPIVKP